MTAAATGPTSVTAATASAPAAATDPRTPTASYVPFLLLFFLPGALHVLSAVIPEIHGFVPSNVLQAHSWIRAANFSVFHLLLTSFIY